MVPLPPSPDRAAERHRVGAAEQVHGELGEVAAYRHGDRLPGVHRHRRQHQPRRAGTRQCGGGDPGPRAPRPPARGPPLGAHPNPLASVNGARRRAAAGGGGEQGPAPHRSGGATPADGRTLAEAAAPAGAGCNSRRQRRHVSGPRAGARAPAVRTPGCGCRHVQGRRRMRTRARVHARGLARGSLAHRRRLARGRRRGCAGGRIRGYRQAQGRRRMRTRPRVRASGLVRGSPAPRRWRDGGRGSAGGRGRAAS